MLRNSKSARRWRLVDFRQGSVNYEFECKVSDRVAIVYAASKPYAWGVYGWPNPSGKPHYWGEANTILEAKQAARKALDAMAPAEI